MKREKVYTVGELIEQLEDIDGEYQVRVDCHGELNTVSVWVCENDETVTL